MNLTTLIQKKETLFNNKKFTKALDYIFGGDFNNKATIDEHGRLVIQYKSKNEGCVVFSPNDDDITVKICKSKHPEECIEWNYQIYNIKSTATLRQFKKFLVSIFWIHFYIAKQVEVDQEIATEVVKLGRLEQQIG